ncbi:ImmA/IrrE family metallo-endopeptidase [Cryobacterium fucosi]|uniref:ImmA/IrrE family metallo-endopeptidase n=1 Tax=Cryobacterium fucosi TaxID=1259157 RepID=A0A4R9AUT9_9MICO|nr:ImmA/IrrE family metallo-endopeptidase [Cryobacterium fucosi]TFD70535.1 ImmA/IrrE family metallo-endopeptidase [Cryobacterium fucosi]
MISNEHTAAKAAANFRLRYGLGSAPISDLNDLIESRLQIDVAILNMAPGLDGMVVQDPETGQRIISVACTLWPERQRATLAHELGHLELGDFAKDGVIECILRTSEEIRADAFARHLLAPSEGVTGFLGGIQKTRRDLNEADLSRVVRYFEVSTQIALIQLDRAGWLAPGQREEWSSLSVGKLAARHGWTDEHQASQQKANTPQAPMRIVELAMDAYENNLIGLEVVARIRGLTTEKVQAELNEYGIMPKPVELPTSRFGRRK